MLCNFCGWDLRQVGITRDDGKTWTLLLQEDDRQQSVCHTWSVGVWDFRGATVRHRFHYEWWVDGTATQTWHVDDITRTVNA